MNPVAGKGERVVDPEVKPPEYQGWSKYERWNLGLANWKFIFTWGYSVDVYGLADARVAIDRGTGRVVLSYLIKK